MKLYSLKLQSYLKLKISLSDLLHHETGHLLFVQEICISTKVSIGLSYPIVFQF